MKELTTEPSITYGLGATPIIDEVRRSKARGRLAQTMLLVGSAMYGLLPTALDMARIILCGVQDDGACGQCSSCHFMNKLQHPDLHLTYPVVKPKDTTTDNIRAEDFLPAFRQFVQHDPFGSYDHWRAYLGEPNKQLMIYNSMIEELETGLSFKSHQGVAKVHLVWGAEYLGIKGNKLLKSIEEPPPHHYILLMAERRHDILPTILSRCQHMLLPKPSQHDLLAKHALLGLSGDLSPGITDFRRLVHGDEDHSMDHQQTWLTLLRLAYNGDGLSLYEQLSGLAQDRSSVCINFFEDGLELCQLLLRARLEIPLDHHTAIERLSRLTDIKHIQAMSDRMRHDLMHIRRNANLKIIMTTWAPFLTRLFHEIKQSNAKP